MEDVNAAPSAAQTPVVVNPTEDVTAEEFISRMSDAEKLHWRKTGEVPDAKPKKDQPQQQESAPAKTGAEKSAKEQSASETDTHSRSEEGDLTEEEFKRLGAKAQRRIRQLLTENKKLKDRPAESAPATRQEPASEPAAPPSKVEFKETRPRPRLDDKDEKGQAKYASYDDYLDARDAWNREQWDAKAKFDKAEADKAAAADAQRRETEKLVSDARKRVEAAKTRNPKLDEALKDDAFAAKIPKRSALDGMILAREKGFDVFAYLYEHPDELDRIVALGPHDQAVEFARIEISLETAAAGEKPGSGKNPPAKKVSDAPPPPREVGGRGTPPEDELEQAIRDAENGVPGASRRYIDLMNRREIAARKAG